MDNGGGGFALIFFIGAYFLPTVMAAIRGHHNGGAILMLNLFLGWTFLGWVVALVWSVTAVQRKVRSGREPRDATRGKPARAETPRRSRPGLVLDVVGESFANADGTPRQDIIKSLKLGERLVLIAEPENPHDDKAVAVQSPLGVIGYLGRDDDDIRAAVRSGQLGFAEVDSVGAGGGGLLGVRIYVLPPGGA